MRWSPDVINKVRQAHDIVDWIGRDTSLKNHSDDRYSGLCPFPDHKEKTPSFSISSVKQVYYCFGCQKGGDLFSYFRDQKGMSFYESVQYLAQQAGINLKNSSSFSPSFSLKNSYLKLNKKVSQYFSEQLENLTLNHPSKIYLKKRGYSEETIQKFKIGYCPRSEKLSTFLGEKDKKLALELGLLSEKGKIYSCFQNRLMFPILSPMNDVIGFGGRALGSSLPKYINSKESLCFQKGHSFYGLNESGGAIRKQGHAIVVEGYTDFLTLYQNGIKNCVATLGTALTPFHCRILRRYTEKVILFFDGDSAGDKAAKRSLPLLLSESLGVRKVELKGIDPDECVSQKGAAYLKEIIKKNQDLFLYIFSNKIKNRKEVEKFDVLREMAPILYYVKDRALGEYYKRYMLDAFSSIEQKSAQMILEDSLKNHKYQESKVNLEKDEVIEEKNSVPVKDEKLSLKSISKPELYLFILALHKAIYLEKIESHFTVALEEQLVLGSFFRQVFDEFHKDKSLFDQLLAKTMRLVSQEGWLQTENFAVLKNLNEEAAFTLIEDCFARLSIEHQNAKLKSLIIQMRSDQDNRIQYLQEIKNIKRNILEFNNGK